MFIYFIKQGWGGANKLRGQKKVRLFFKIIPVNWRPDNCPMGGRTPKNKHWFNTYKRIPGVKLLLSFSIDLGKP